MKKISGSEHHELFIIAIKLIATHNALNRITQAGKLVGKLCEYLKWRELFKG